jgi:hypothetical protein
MKTTTAARVPLPLVPPGPGPVGLDDRLCRPRVRRLDPGRQARAHTDAHNPGPRRLLPAAALPLRAAKHPAGSIARLFAPETLS